MSAAEAASDPAARDGDGDGEAREPADDGARAADEAGAAPDEGAATEAAAAAATEAAATEAAKEAAAREAAAAAARWTRAEALVEERRLPEAELELAALLALVPAHLPGWRLLARVRLGLGRAADAEAALAALVARAPTDADARFELGLLALRRGDHAAAAAELEATLGLRPDHPRAQQYLGFAWAKLGRGDAAANAFTRAGAPELAAAARALGERASALSPPAAADAVALASLVADQMLPAGQAATGVTTVGPGVHRLVVEHDSATHVAPGAIIALFGPLTLEPAVRRRPGRLAELATETPGPEIGAGPRLLRCRGHGEIWVGAARRGRGVLSLALEDDNLFLREARVLGFSGALGWDAGALPGTAAAVLHFHGRGAVLVDFAAADLVTLRVSAAAPVKLPVARLYGWMGEVVLQPDRAPSDGGARLVACEGEGALLIAKTGGHDGEKDEQPGESVHERAESGDHGPGRAHPRGALLHR